MSEKGEEKLKLHLGCGDKYLEGYVNVDYPPSEHTVISPKADLYQDIRTLEYDDNSVDEIRSHHLLEHFSRAEALKLLLQWRRWLKPDGLLVVETPDFEASIKAYLRAFTRKRRMEIGRHIFGTQEAHWAYHYDFWDRRKFRFVLKKLGFKDIRVRRFRNSAAKHYKNIPFINFIGSIVPNSVYYKYGGNKLPDIVVKAKKDAAALVDEEVVIRELLSEYLTVHDDHRMLHAWVQSIGGNKEHQAESEDTESNIF